MYEWLCKPVPPWFDRGCLIATWIGFFIAIAIVVGTCLGAR